MLLRTHDIVLMDGSLVLRPMTEHDWEIVAAWNDDPDVLWFTDNGAVSERSLEELQRNSCDSLTHTPPPCHRLWVLHVLVSHEAASPSR